jgi:hypothetical protein
MKRKEYNLTRKQAISLILQITDRDDPFWENLVDEYYDEETDSMPFLDDVLMALGVSEKEIREASK